MSNEIENSLDEQRWQKLLGAHTFGEVSREEFRELQTMAEQDAERGQQLQMLQRLSTMVPLELSLADADRRLAEQIVLRHSERVARHRSTKGRIALGLVLLPAAAAASVIFLWTKDSLRLSTHGTPASVTSFAPAPLPAAPAAEASPESMQKEPDSTVEEPFGEVVQDPETSIDKKPLARPTAFELLAKAQEARAEREYERAIVLYRKVQKLHPGTSEARLARISLAQLLLTQGDPEAALAGFSAHQRDENGHLVQEAHYGKIQALRALGRVAEERAEIQRFLALYPASIQSAALKRRLGAIGEGR